MDNTLKASDKFRQKFKDVSGYWVTKNKDEAVSILDYLNNINFASSVNSFDFKKLYTNIPPDDVLKK